MYARIGETESKDVLREGQMKGDLIEKFRRKLVHADNACVGNLLCSSLGSPGSLCLTFVRNKNITRRCRLPPFHVRFDIPSFSSDLRQKWLLNLNPGPSL